MRQEKNKLLKSACFAIYMLIIIMTILIFTTFSYKLAMQVFIESVLSPIVIALILYIFSETISTLKFEEFKKLNRDCNAEKIEK